MHGLCLSLLPRCLSISESTRLLPGSRHVPPMLSSYSAPRASLLELRCRPLPQGRLDEVWGDQEDHRQRKRRPIPAPQSFEEFLHKPAFSMAASCTQNPCSFRARVEAVQSSDG